MFLLPLLHKCSGVSRCEGSIVRWINYRFVRVPASKFYLIDFHPLNVFLFISSLTSFFFLFKLSGYAP